METMRLLKDLEISKPGFYWCHQTICWCNTRWNGKLFMLWKGILRISVFIVTRNHYLAIRPFPTIASLVVAKRPCILLSGPNTNGCMPSQIFVTCLEWKGLRYRESHLMLIFMHTKWTEFKIPLCMVCF